MSYAASGQLDNMQKFSGAVDGPDYEEWLREVEAAAAGEFLPDLLPLLWRHSTGRARLALEGCGAPITLPLAQRKAIALARNSAKDSDIEPAAKLLDERRQKAVDALKAQFTGRRYHSRVDDALRSFVYDDVNPEISLASFRKLCERYDASHPAAGHVSDPLQVIQWLQDAVMRIPMGPMWSNSFFQLA